MKTNTLVFGPIGGGKSYSIRTLLATYFHLGTLKKGVGLTVLSQACEPGWAATNEDLTCEMGFHVNELLPANPDFVTSLAWLETIKEMGTKELIDKSLPYRILKDYQQFMSLYRNAINFKCDKCNTEFGNLEDLDDSFAIVNDGLTGISKMSEQMIKGPKPQMSLPEYGRAQGQVEGWVNKMCTLKASYILLAHWSREPDPVEGGTNITINTVGNKLAPKLLLDTFDEIILAQRDVDKYSWNLAVRDVDQKARRLQYKNGLAPDFGQIFRTR